MYDFCFVYTLEIYTRQQQTPATNGAVNKGLNRNSAIAPFRLIPIC
jgi:hypothetical protein